MRRLPLTVLLVALGCGRDPTAPIDPSALSFTVISGDNQTGVVGTELPDPLVIRAFQKGIPARGIVVNFHVTSGGGSMFAGAVITDNRGFAQDYWTLGTTAGAPQRVEVRAVLSNRQKQVFGRFSAFAVAGPAVQLVFLVQPSDVVAGEVIAPPVQVAAADVSGNIALSFAGIITLSIGDNPSAGVLSGTLSRAAVAGISVYSDLSIDKAGAGYTLVASSPGLISRVSDAFNITP